MALKSGDKKSASFSFRVKEELSNLILDKKTPVKPCCQKAQAYGLLQCGHSFAPGKISLKTENVNVAACYKWALIKACGLDEDDVEYSVLARIISISVENSAEGTQDDKRLRILELFGHSKGEVSLRINRSNFDCEECFKAYLRGAFLSCGSISNPVVDYHLEINIPFYRLSNDFLALMREANLNARMVERKGSYIIYLKESGQIEDFLTLTGAMMSSLEIMNVKMVKDIRNNVNRQANCESANIEKTVTASVNQVHAIKEVIDKAGLESLSDELKAVALARLENPDLSLRELGELLEPPLSRSGVNHRLQKLIELAQSLAD